MTEPVMVGGGPAAPGNRRVLVLGGVAVALVLVALVLPKLLFGGGGEDDAFDDLGAPLVAPAGGLSADLDAEADEPARTFQSFSTKNPFTPLIEAAVSAPATPVEAAPAPAPVVPAPVVVPVVPVAVAPAPAPAPTPITFTPVPVAPAPAPAPADPTPAPAPAPAPGSQRVTLLDVYVAADGITMASVRVGEVVHEVATGADFAERFRAVTLSVADGCGQFLHGDERFRLCEGDEVVR